MTASAGTTAGRAASSVAKLAREAVHPPRPGVGAERDAGHQTGSPEAMIAAASSEASGSISPAASMTAIVVPSGACCRISGGAGGGALFGPGGHGVHDAQDERQQCSARQDAARVVWIHGGLPSIADKTEEHS